ncbi:MAG: DUF2628 domain-containing protein [Faecalibacterium sp.]|jgi:hypothetical protein|nr:DUF2628 domain-containing protein [Faecalibacterium sp.]
MYDFTGCECPVCHQLFRPDDDLVVCPDCGTPYHRACYEKAGRCVYSASHGPDFAWAPPHKAAAEAAHVCSVCGTENPAENRYCKNCGAPMSGQPEKRRPVAAHASGAAPQENAASKNSAAGKDASFDYSQLYRSATASPESSPFGANAYVAIDPNESMDGIPAAEWAAYIGPSSRIYLMIFKQMEVLRHKISFSFSAMLFGPFYYIYRKAWKPALFFGLLACLTRVPMFLSVLQITDSALTAGLSAVLLENLQRAAGMINYALMFVSGMYGFYLYKKSAAEQIRRIQQQYPDTQKRSYVLNAQGGTSIGAVIALFLGFMALIYIGMFLFMGPNVNALVSALGYPL